MTDPIRTIYERKNLEIFSGSQSVRHGQIAPLLKKLHTDGLIACQHVQQHDRPNKKLYSITPKGREELIRWLRQQYVDLERRHFPGGLERCTSDDQRYAYFTLKRGVMFLDDSITWCDWSIRILEQQARNQASPVRKKPGAGRGRRLDR